MWETNRIIFHSATGSKEFLSLESKREADATPVTITLIGLAASLIAATPLKCQGINNIFNHDRTGKKDASKKLAKILVTPL